MIPSFHRDVSPLIRCAVLAWLVVFCTVAWAVESTLAELDPIVELIQQRRFEDAEREASALLERLEVQSSVDPVIMARTRLLRFQARAHLRVADPEVRREADEVLAAWGRIVPESSMEFAEHVDEIASILVSVGDFYGALPLRERSLAIREDLLGPDHLDVAESVTNLGIVRERSGDYEGAMTLFQRALAIRESALDPMHPDLAKSLNNLGIMFLVKARYAEARPYLERSVAIREEVLGPEHPDLAKSLRNLSEAIWRLEGPAEAIPIVERALVIQEAAFGTEHYAPAYTQNFIASMYEDAGRLVDARMAYEQSVERLERTLGPEHPHSANARRGLATLQDLLGEVEAARANRERACAVLERTLGPEHIYLGHCVIDMASAARKRDDFDEAVRLAERASEIFRTAIGEADTTWLAVREWLAWIRYDQGDLDGAARLARSCLDNLDDDSQVSSKLFAEATLLIAFVDRQKDRRLEARRGFERVMQLEAVVGAEDITIMDAREQLAYALADMGEIERAVDLAVRQQELQTTTVRLLASSLSERQAMRYADDRYRAATTLSVAASGVDPATGTKVWDAVIRSRAAVLDELAARHRWATGSVEPEVVERLEDLRRSRAKLSTLLVRDRLTEDDPQLREMRDAARARVAEAERALGAVSREFRQEQQRREVSFREVRHALSSSDALIAYVRYIQYELASASEKSTSGELPRLWRKEPNDGVESYMAIVLPAGAAAPLFVPLGPAQEIDLLVQQWREAALLEPDELLSGGRGAEAAFREVGTSLRRMIWDPAVGKAADADRIFVVPDGALHLVNLAALPTGDQGYLVESGPLLHFLATERDLVLPEERSDRKRGLLALGGPDFSASTSGRSAAADELSPQTMTAARQRRAVDDCQNMRNLVFGPLPGAALEAKQLASLWKHTPAAANEGPVMELTEAQASEMVFKREASNYGVLHLATHGFFESEPCRSSQADGRNDSLDFSGLALAGANRRHEFGVTDMQSEDGILTAEEIAGLDLSGVDWVVLSACGSGLGTVRSSEGVLGLRRSFRMAGANTLILSLWDVDDIHTRVWMEDLYRARLGGQSSAESVRDASRRMIARRRELNLSTHPYYWGAFVATGDWH